MTRQPAERVPAASTDPAGCEPPARRAFVPAVRDRPAEPTVSRDG